MARYHINNKDEVKPCSAKIKCRFGGRSGQENHFSSRTEAEVFLQKSYEEAYSDKLAGVTRGKGREVLAKLSRQGVKVTPIASVQDHTFTPTGEGSAVDVLSEKPSPAFLEAIKRGEKALAL